MNCILKKGCISQFLILLIITLKKNTQNLILRDQFQPLGLGDNFIILYRPSFLIPLIVLVKGYFLPCSPVGKSSQTTLAFQTFSKHHQVFKHLGAVWYTTMSNFVMFEQKIFVRMQKPPPPASLALPDSNTVKHKEEIQSLIGLHNVFLFSSVP